MQFQLLLQNETWESVYKDKDINNKYNSFLYTFLNIFEASFPIKYVSIGKIKKGIKVSCKRKRSVHIYSRNSNDPNTKELFTLSIVKF
jgi:hypothetical protein